MSNDNYAIRYLRLQLKRPTTSITPTIACNYYYHYYYYLFNNSLITTKQDAANMQISISSRKPAISVKEKRSTKRCHRKIEDPKNSPSSTCLDGQESIERSKKNRPDRGKNRRSLVKNSSIFNAGRDPISTILDRFSSLPLIDGSSRAAKRIRRSIFGAGSVVFLPFEGSFPRRHFLWDLVAFPAISTSGKAFLESASNPPVQIEKAARHHRALCCSDEVALNELLVPKPRSSI